MSHSLKHRTFLWAAAATFFVIAACTSWAAGGSDATSAQPQFAQLERELNGRLGVFALDTSNGAQLSYRANERFPVCSTFKAFLAAAILKQSTETAGLMHERIRYTQSDLVAHSPVTEKHVANGMTVAELLAAMLKYSDNTATNLLMKKLGGPAAVTQFVQSIGNRQFRLDNWEPNLNTVPGDLRDTSTPEAMGRGLQQLVLADVLKDPQRKHLKNGLLSNSVADQCIRAGVPAGWKVADRSGGGLYGTRNDIAILYPPNRAPIILAIFTTQHAKEAAGRDDVIASATRLVVGWVHSSR